MTKLTPQCDFITKKAKTQGVVEKMEKYLEWYFAVFTGVFGAEEGI
jgi:hypothetical protein